MGSARVRRSPPALLGAVAAPGRPSLPGPRALVALGAAAVSVVGALAALDLLAHKPSLLVPLLIAGALVPLLIARPEWIVPAYLAFTWTSIGRGALSGLSPVNYGAYVLLPVSAWFAWRGRREQARAVAYVFAAIALPLVATGLLSVFGPEVPSSWFKALAFMVIAGLCLTESDVDRTIVALVLVGVFLSLGAVYSVRVHPTSLFALDPTGATPGHPSTSAPRAAGPLGESNFFALSLAALMPLALHLLGSGGWRQRLGVIAVPCLIAGIYSTGSRGGVLAAGLSILLMALFSGSRRVRTGGIVTVLVGAVLLLAFQAQASSSASRSVSGRATENLVAIAMFKDHPLVGIGPGQYPNLYSLYTPKIGNDNRPVRDAHSLPLQIAAEQGIVGILGWLAAIVFMVRLVRAGRAWRDPVGQAVVVALVTYMAGSLVLHGDDLRMPFILTGMVIVMSMRPGRVLHRHIRS